MPGTNLQTPPINGLKFHPAGMPWVPEGDPVPDERRDRGFELLLRNTYTIAQELLELQGEETVSDPTTRHREYHWPTRDGKYIYSLVQARTNESANSATVWREPVVFSVTRTEDLEDPEADYVVRVNVGKTLFFTQWRYQDNDFMQSQREEKLRDINLWICNELSDVRARAAKAGVAAQAAASDEALVEVLEPEISPVEVVALPLAQPEVRRAVDPNLLQRITYLMDDHEIPYQAWYDPSLRRRVITVRDVEGDNPRLFKIEQILDDKVERPDPYTRITVTYVDPWNGKESHMGLYLLSAYGFKSLDKLPRKLLAGWTARRRYNELQRSLISLAEQRG